MMDFDAEERGKYLRCQFFFISSAKNCSEGRTQTVAKMLDSMIIIFSGK